MRCALISINIPNFPQRVGRDACDAALLISCKETGTSHCGSVTLFVCSCQILLYGSWAQTKSQGKLLSRLLHLFLQRFMHLSIRTLAPRCVGGTCHPPLLLRKLCVLLKRYIDRRLVPLVIRGLKAKQWIHHHPQNAAKGR